MKSNLKDIIESIPDFDDFMKIADEIGQLSLEKMRLETTIKSEEAETFKKVMFGEGKPPSVSFVTNAYLHTGIDGKLLEYRYTLASVISLLEKRKLQLAIYRDMLEIFRTVSANERSISV